MPTNKHRRRVSFQTLEGRQLMAADAVRFAPVEAINETPAMVFHPVATESLKTRETRSSVSAIFSAPSVSESGTVNLIVTRDDTNLDKPLIVRVAGGDPTQLAMPTTITIRAGQRQAIMRLNPIDDRVAEKPMKLDFTFSAVGHRSAMASIELLDNEPPKFQNPKLAWDVNNDGNATALDALLVINMLSRQSGSEIDTSSVPTQGQFHDVNGDYRISALDALQVINALSHDPTNQQTRSTIAAVDQFHNDAIRDEQPPSEQRLF